LKEVLAGEIKNGSFPGSGEPEKLLLLQILLMLLM
jgi:hypothetical protein